MESVSLTLEALMEQRRGYRDLALEYVSGLKVRSPGPTHTLLALLFFFVPGTYVSMSNRFLFRVRGV